MTDHSSQLQSNPFLSRFLGGLPRDVANSFTTEQLAAVQRAFGMRYSQPHAIDMRRTVRVMGRRIYLVLLVGRERAEDTASPYLGYGVAAALVSAGLLLLL